ncbi:MAG: DUF4091 domain-containing protein [Ruminococcaceae bacterium]|nr:DUF4091 domain-containing protein [Oscillospiraceae bacterium]
MKKIIAVILLICTVLSISSCDSGDQKPSGGDNGPANLKSWTFHSFEKTIVNAAPNGTFKTDYKVYLSKGETEGCQVAIYSDKEIKNVSLTLKSGETELIKPAMFSMNRTHKIARKQYTDSLIPYYGKRLTIEANVILPFMIEFTTDENTPAGDYEYVYELVDKEKNVLATYNITVHVWDFELPKEKTFATSAGLRSDYIAHFNGTYNEAIYTVWYEALLEHNLSAYYIPYGIFDERGEKYMSDPRVTSFMVVLPTDENGKLIEDEVTKIRARLKENPEWLKKAFFLPLDEPHNEKQLAELKEWEETLTRLCPEVEIMAPYYTNIQVGEGRDQTDEMEAYTDLWCPKLCLWDDERSYGDFLNYTPSKSFHERMNEQIAKGDRMWSYVCNDPDDPYAQLFVDTEGVNQRLMFWQMYQRDIKGFLYWCANYYGYSTGGKKVPINPWNSTNTKVTNGQGITIFGEGFLFYPGSEIGFGGAVPSIRAKIVRDGIDDLEMFYLAEKYLDKDWIVNKTKEGTPTLTEYANGDKYASLRIEIGNALEAEMKK